MHACVLVADEGEIYELLNRFANYDGDEEKPEARWDYFGIGGLFEGALPLKTPRTVRRLFGLLSSKQISHATIAKKAEIDCACFLAEPPAALYFRGVLYECPLFAQGDALARWDEEFRRVFASIPEDTTLRIVDAHT
jgi:hypothetical protein